MNSKSIRVLRKRDAMIKLGLRESSFDDVRRKDTTFPKAIALSAKAIGFLEHELDTWIETRPRINTASAVTAGELEEES